MVWQTTVSNADKKKVAVVTQTQIVIAGKREQGKGKGRRAQQIEGAA
jgi:hypothetical protein